MGNRYDTFLLLFLFKRFTKHQLPRFITALFSISAGTITILMPEGVSAEEYAEYLVYDINSNNTKNLNRCSNKFVRPYIERIRNGGPRNNYHDEDEVEKFEFLKPSLHAMDKLQMQNGEVIQLDMVFCMASSYQQLKPLNLI
uniref:Uncharacterized protein n=1 Tax=Romanomermis culicivorax TaxID=13658 RepID=A0A915JNQ1_ROMCU